MTDLACMCSPQRSRPAPATLQFFLDFERKAVRAAGGDERTSEDSSIWLPIDRAVELMRNEFRNARAPDIAKATLEIEDLVRLPNEIIEYSKRFSSMMAAGESSAKAGAAGVAAAKADVSARLSGCTVAAPSSAASAARSSAAATAVAAAAAAAADSELYAGLEPALASSLHSMLHDRQGLEVLDQKGTDEKEKVLQRRDEALVHASAHDGAVLPFPQVLQRRDEALVQNKVLRALSRRGLSLRELFHLLDTNGDGEIDPSEFVKGVQV